MNTENKKIQYKQVIALGFKRKDLGGDSVFFDEHGYDWFIASKTLVKEQGCKIVANWHPETKDIEVLYLDKKRNVVSRQRFSGQHGLARYRAIQLFFCPKQKSVGHHNQKEEDFSKQTEASHAITAKQAAERLQDFAAQIKQANKPIPSIGVPFNAGLLDFDGKSIFVSGRFPRVGEIDIHGDIHMLKDARMEVTETYASYIPVFDPATGLYQFKLPKKNK